MSSFAARVAGPRRDAQEIFNPFLFAGEYRDPESGLYYLRARYYDPRTAQFISADPLYVKTRQRYSYVLDNPINHQDPSGLVTAGWCASLSGSVGLFSGFLQGCVQTATKDPVTSWSTLALASCLIAGLPAGAVPCYQYSKSVKQVGVTGTYGLGLVPQNPAAGTGQAASANAPKPNSVGDSISFLSQLQFSNANDISGLGNWFCYAGGGGGDYGLAGGVSIFSGVCPDPNNLSAGFRNPGTVTNGFDIGAGFGTPGGGASIGYSCTIIFAEWNVNESSPSP